MNWAATFGENTQTVIQHFLTVYTVEQQGYKACMALLKLSDKYPPERVEGACRKALTFTPQPSYKIIQSILKSGQDKLCEAADEPETAPRKASQYSFTRGAEYYRRDK